MAETTFHAFNLSLHSYQSESDDELSDYKFWDVFRDPLWLLHNFHRKYKHIRVPTNAGWGISHVNGGAAFTAFYVIANTSITASSRALGFALTYGLNSGNILQYRIDWTKRMELSFILSREVSDVEVIARLQLKTVNTEGVMAAKGIGLQISNYTVVGEAYGTALQTTGTLKILTNGTLVRVKIIKTSTSVDFYVDNVLVGSLTGTAVPNVVGTADSYLVLSIINGATGGVNAYLVVGNIEVVHTW